MFRAIHIGNFKAFGPTQRIPIRPLTLIFGPNSAGKSSFIHALLFTHEALTSDEPNNLDVHRPRIGGDSVDLGGFRQFVHRGNTDAQVELSYEFGAEVLAEQNSLFLSACHSVRVTFGLGLERLDSETGIPTKTDRSPWVGQVVRRIAPDKRESIDKLLDHAVQQGLAVSHSRAQILIKIKTGDPTDALAVPTLVVVSRDGDVEVVTKWLYRDLAPILGDGNAARTFVDRLVERLRRFQISNPRFPGRHYYAVHGNENRFIRIIADAALQLRRSWQDMHPDQTGLVRLKTFAVDVDERPLFSMSGRSGHNLKLDTLDRDHPRFLSRLQDVVNLAHPAARPTRDESRKFGEMLDSLVPKIVATTRGLRVQIDEPPEHWMGPAFLPGELLIGEPVGTRDEILFNVARLFLPGVLREIVNDSIELLDETIQRVRYLGPLRSYPQRHLAFSEDHDRNWFAGGGYAWDRLRNDSHLRERVNQWLAGSWMKTPYQLVVRDLYGEEDLEVPFLELLQEKEEKLRESLEHEGFDPFSLRSVFGDPEREFSRFCREIAASAAVPIKELALIDVAKKTTVSHRDVGIGISQVLPVLVSAMAAQNETIAIEQPEIHLHPALQAELGDVFIEAALSGRGNRFILETHSEHLLLRIMRRIRETTTEKLPKGCTPITKDDVLVLYVEPDKDGAIAREMPLNEMGELVKAWPGGFFEEGLREIF